MSTKKPINMASDVSVDPYGLGTLVRIESHTS